MNSATPKVKSNKKWLWIGGIILVLVIISAAGQDNTPKEVGNTGGATSQPAAKSTDTVYSVGDQVQLGKSIVTVLTVERSQGGAYSKPQPGNEWLNLSVTIQNTDSSQQYITTLGQMFVRDAEGNSYQVAVTDRILSNVNARLDGQIIANSKRTGWVGFEIPEGATGLQFQYNGSMWGGGQILVNL